MNTTRFYITVVALLCSVAFWLASRPARALPIGGHPDKCQGPYPQGGPGCEARGGQVWCTNDGDYMCCFVDAQGHQDCTQIESFQVPKGHIGQFSGGKLQTAPLNPPPRTSPIPKAGMNAPIMRRGVEGELSDSPPAPSEAPAESK